MSYSHGDLSAVMTSMTEGEIFDECLSGLARLYSVGEEFVRGQFVTGKVKKWSLGEEEKYIIDSLEK